MKRIALAIALVSAVGLYAKDKKENIADLKSADDAVAIKAAQELGNDGVKDAIEPLGELVKSNRATGVRLVAAAALGRMDTKGRPMAILRESIEADQDNGVVYASLLALLNLAVDTKDFENADLAKAVEFCENNKKSDPYISDITARIRKKFPPKKDAPK